MAFKFIWQDYSVNRTMLTVELFQLKINKLFMGGFFVDICPGLFISQVVIGSPCCVGTRLVHS